MVGDEIVARVRGPNQVTVVKTDVDGQWADLNVTLSFIHIAGLVGPKSRKPIYEMINTNDFIFEGTLLN